MGVPVKTRIAYRLYIWLGKDRYYANPSGKSHLDVSWRKRTEEYPACYTYQEMQDILHKYLDQHVRYEEVHLLDEDE